jgi:hypothetical protein
LKQLSMLQQSELLLQLPYFETQHAPPSQELFPQSL